MSRSVYNLMWSDLPPSLDPEFNYDLELQGLNNFDELPLTRGVILFPSLGTPHLYFEGVDEPWIELLIATARALTPEMVNRQLKLCPGIDPHKPCEGLPLFGGAYAGTEDAPGNILVERATAESGLLRTHSRFRGAVHDSFQHHLDRLGLARVYRVRLRASVLDRPDESDAHSFLLSEEKERFLGYKGPRKGPALVGMETHDAIIRAMLDDRIGPESSKGTPLAGRGRYCFKRGKRDVDISVADARRPVQSYHPLFVYRGDDARAETTLGFASDIHVNVRCAILGRSTARVIEYADTDAHEGESPRVGDLLKETNRSFTSVLENLCALEPTAIVLGGDFIDHVRNAYAPTLLMSSAPRPADVWDAVAMGDRYTNERYPGYVDFTAFYTFIFDAMVKYTMPFFVVSGNHDAYPDAFGISPRVSRIRTNETIPADLNLTMYEAILAFGPYAGSVPLPTLSTFFDRPDSMGPTFEAHWFDWVYTVLTPFTDYAEAFPKLSLVGLGWGDTEDMGSLLFQGQGVGYLGRASSSMSPTQLALIDATIARGRPLTLATHFTFVSYLESKASSESGYKEAHNHPSFSDFEMGTFEVGAHMVIPKLKSGAINCVLSGHSHRRALYHFDGPFDDGHHPVRCVDIPPGGLLNLDGVFERAKAVMIVSDSAGPYPKRNVWGEFSGFGMDMPSGTLVRYRDGRPRSVEPVFAYRGLPRAAVALDFLDVTSGVVFASPISDVEGEIALLERTTEERDVGEVSTSIGSSLSLNLSALLRDRWQVRVVAVRLVRWDVTGVPVRVAFEPDGHGAWFAGNDSLGLLDARLPPDTRWFLSLSIDSGHADLKGRYDWSSAWNIEVEPKEDALDYDGERYGVFALRRPMRVMKGLGLSYGQRLASAAALPLLDTFVGPFLDAEQVWAEVPDFPWRAEAMPEKYRPSKG